MTFPAHRANSIAHPNDGIGTGSFIEEATCESSLISSRNSSIDSQVQPQQMANFQMKPKSSPNRLVFYGYVDSGYRLNPNGKVLL